MYWRVVMVLTFLIGTGAATTAHAVGVTTYGTGLKTCGAYLDAREQQNADEVAFVDWLSGYLSGVNATSIRTNNILGDSNLKGAVYWVGKYCRAHPTTPFSAAAFALLMGASASTATHGAQATTYGTGFKSCETYLDARELRNTDEMAFVDWLGGYLSGVNAISKSTSNILGTSDLTGAIYWLDNYCREHSPARFAAAADARVAAGITAVAEATPPSRR
ncbi:MAG: hypothetical protein ACHQDD_00770 [Steroidobacterales bacterium]